MIYSFQYEKRFVNLLPLSVQEGKGWNVFAASSMSLLIGANGSGKTDFLSRLCTAVQDGDHSVVDVNGELDAHGVIYFTPAPLARSRFPRNGKRIKVIDAGRKRSVPSHDVVRELSREFRFSSSMVAKLTAPLDRGLDALVAAVMESPKEVGPALFDNLGLDSKDYWIVSQKWRSEGSAQRTGAKQRQQDMLRAQGTFRVSIRRFLRRNFGANGSNAILAALAFDAVNRRGRPAMARRFLREIERGSFNFDRVGARLDDFLQLFESLGAKIARAGVPVSNALQDKLAAEFGDIITFEIAGLSSGAEALVWQFFELRCAIDELYANGVRALLLMIDEGDAFLHIAWQQKYIEFLNRFISREGKRFDSLQVIVASHSPVLMSDFPKDFVISLGDEANDGCQRCFGAPLEMIIESTAGAGTVGAFAAKKMKQLIGRNEFSARDKYLIGQIDDPIVRSFLMRRSGDNID